MIKKIKLAVLFLSFALMAKAQPFIHPGILHSREDLERMKKAVAAREEPIYSGYEVFIQNPVSQSTYKMQGPMTTVGRNPTVGQGVYDTDANAAHQNAIMWAISGDKAYADKAIEILNAWASTLRSVTGKDAVLMAGLGPFKMVNAAEIIRYTNAGWKEADIRQTERHFKEVIYPVIKNYAPFANGNWDAAAMKTVMAIAVFCNDRPMFNDVLKYYINGHGNGALRHYVINEEGQIQESGRDQGHTQLGIGMLAECSEIAWHQGLNLYGYAGNRLLKGFEYVAKFNLGKEVPFVETLDHTGKYHHLTIARQDRGPLRAVYEQVYNHYVKRVGLQARFTQQAAEKVRPEGPGKPGADHPGYGTLFFTQTTGLKSVHGITVPAAPAGIIADAKPSGIELCWVEPVGAVSYTVKRAEKPGGPYRIVAQNNTAAKYTDTSTRPGKLYYYQITASNEKGESKSSEEAAVSAGLPLPWKQTDIGTVLQPGFTQFNGREFMLNASGMGVDSLADSFHYAAVPFNGKSEISFRYVPQLSSQFSSFGIAVRAGTAANAAQVSLSIFPGKTDQVELPEWQVRFSSRIKPGTANQVINTIKDLPETAVTYGRMTGYYWLRLKCEGKKVKAFVSADGKEWTEAGTTEITFSKGLIGLFAASGMPNSTVIKFDNVLGK